MVAYQEAPQLLVDDAHLPV